MYCLKCGKETGSERVFCDSCLESMEKYPVKPGIHIHLPNRPAFVQRKTVRRRMPTPEERVVRQRRVIRVLSLCLATVSVLLILCAVALFT